MAGYDPKKAATYNKLIKQGLSEEAAQAQAGISDAEGFNYVIDATGSPKTNPNYGTMGSWVSGGGGASGAFQPGTTEQTITPVNYNVKAENPPSTRTQNEYTQTSTTQNSGKQVFIAATKPTDTAASRALQPQIEAKQAEFNQFVKDNPSDFVRKKQGLPPMTPAELAAREQQYAKLSQEKLNLTTQQNELKTPGEPARFETANTTTSATTTTFGTASTDTPVNSPDAADPAIAQQEDLRLAQSNPGSSLTPITAPAPLVQEQIAPAAPIPLVATDAPEPVDAAAVPEVVIDEPQNQPLLTPEQSIAQAQTVPAEQDPAAAAADFNEQTQQDVRTAIGVKAPAPVDPAQSPGATSPFAAQRQQQNEQIARNPEAVEANLQAAQEAQLKQQAAVQAEFQSPASGDWRVRLRLAPGATYLYKDTDVATSILAPLAASNGVVFPYMPTIQTSYNATYDSTDLTHSNYRGQFYKSSYVGDISLTGIFTAQDTAEANYLLAVIHFFRSVTKMFYGARDPLRGSPPPLVYLIGLGQYQFNNQPCVVKQFAYSMPNDCDYIRTKPNNYNVNLNDRQTKTDTGSSNPFTAVLDRLRNAGLKKGALPNVPAQSLLDLQSVNNIDNATYVPTKCEISITLMPIQTRNQQSRLFNMQDYASGKLLKGGFW